MRERLDKILEQLKELNEKIGKKNRRIILIVVILVIIGLIIGIRLASRTTYEVLYTGLSADNQVEILGAIESLGVPSKSYDNGTIEVPTGQADSVRAQLAMQGQPKSGTNYDIFTNNVSITSTDFEKETYKLYELQDRLSATIEHFDGVRSATVTIAPGEESKYVLSADDANTSTTASVAVIMEGGGSPTEEQVRGIQTLVSTSVPGMTNEEVSVIDGNGNDVSGMAEDGLADSKDLSSLKIELENHAETSIRAKVLNLLEPIYGEDNVRVAVNCVVDIDRTISEMITYYPSDPEGTGNNTGVTSHMGLNWESIGEGDVAGGVVGTETNSEVPIYPYVAEGDDGNYYADSRTYDYLVSQLTEQIEKDAGEIIDTNVSVVIGNGNLTDEEIVQLEELVGVTAGIDQPERAEKVAVMDTIFAEAPIEVEDFIDRILALGPLLYIIIGAALLLLIILIAVIIMLRKRRKRKQEQLALLEPDEDEQDVDWELEPINLESMQETKEQVLRDQIRDFASQNPEIAASLIKNWLKEEEV